MLIHFAAGLDLAVRTSSVAGLLCRSSTTFATGRACIRGGGSQMHKIQCKSSESGGRVVYKVFLEMRGTAGVLFRVLRSRPSVFLELRQGPCLLFPVFGIRTEVSLCICSHASLQGFLGVICLRVFLVASFFDLLVSQEEPRSGLYLYFFSAMLTMVLIH